jgi:pyridoxal phosphate enzyme (YggS family)
MTQQTATAAALGASLNEVRARIERACGRAGRDPGSVRLLPVSKSVPADSIGEAIDLGLTTFGENRVQEAETKAAALAAARWELIGHLQSNKAGRAVALFDAIHSVDSVDLARRLDRLAADAGRPTPLPIYIEVNVDDDPAKAGFSPPTLEAAVADLASLPNLELAGLMTVGRLVNEAEQARPTFRRLRDLSDRLRHTQPALGAALSMGMSSDFEVAIEEGSTVVRIGSALFGPRSA